MSDRIDELGTETNVVLITFTDPTNLDAYADTNELPFPILVDPDREGYRAYGLGRGSVARMYGRKALGRYLEIFRSDGLRGLRFPTEDTLQLGGDFVIDPAGNLSYGFWGSGPDDRPSVDELINAIADVAT